MLNHLVFLEEIPVAKSTDLNPSGECCIIIPSSFCREDLHLARSEACSRRRERNMEEPYEPFLVCSCWFFAALP